MVLVGESRGHVLKSAPYGWGITCDTPCYFSKIVAPKMLSDLADMDCGSSEKLGSFLHILGSAACDPGGRFLLSHTTRPG